MFLLRHGQSEFNLHFTTTRRDPGIVDPRLTDEGHAQARAAGEALRGQGIRRIITSPYTRALETAVGVNAALGAEILINPIVRERYAFKCDIGTPRTELVRDWPHIDFSHIDEVWWPDINEPEPQVEARAALFRAEMAALGGWAAETLVVSHWGFLLALTGETMANGSWRAFDPTAPAPTDLSWPKLESVRRSPS